MSTMSLLTIWQRTYTDLLTVAGKPLISYGPPGRSAVTGHVATVFGCTGFLGRYLVAKLGQYRRRFITFDR